MGRAVGQGGRPVRAAEKLPVVRNVCQRCGKIFHGSGPLCDDCISIIRIEEQRRAAARKDYFRRLYAGY